jgi:hypothetical protein
MEEALRLTNGNKSAAAKMLGLKRTTLVAKLRKRSNSSTARSSGRINKPDKTLAALHARTSWIKNS